MGLDRMVKLKHTDNLSAARLAAGIGVDFIGMDYSALLEETAKKEAESMAEWLSGPSIVLEMPFEFEVSKVVELCNDLPIDALDLPYQSLSMELKSALPKPIQFLRISAEDRSPEELVQAYKTIHQQADFIVLEIYDPVKLKEINAEFQSLIQNKGLMVSTDFTVDTLDQFSLDYPDTAIEIPAAKEEKPGVLMDAHLAELLELLEMD